MALEASDQVIGMGVKS